MTSLHKRTAETPGTCEDAIAHLPLRTLRLGGDMPFCCGLEYQPHGNDQEGHP